MTLNENLQNIGKFKIGNIKRTIYKLKKKNKTVYYYNKNKDNKSVKIYLKKKPKDYSSKFINYKYNKGSKSKSFDVYIDKNPKDTIPIKYTTLDDVKNTIKKLEKLYKQGKYPHKRIWQVGMILRVRLKVLKDKKPQQYKLAEKYFQHLGKRTKIKNENDRKKLKFNYI